MTPKQQMDKVEEFLKQKKIDYTRRDRFSEEEQAIMELTFSPEDWGEQIIAYDKNGDRWWDIIYGFGAHGNDERPFEGMGRIFIPDIDDDAVEDYLTAQNIIDRIEDYLTPHLSRGLK